MVYNKTCFHVIINRCSDNLLVPRLTFGQALARRALENWHQRTDSSGRFSLAHRALTNWYQRGEAEAPPG